MGTTSAGHDEELSRVEAVCAAVHRAAHRGHDLALVVPEIVAITGGDAELAEAALSTCARRSLNRSDGWFQAARLLEEALATDAFGPGRGTDRPAR
jgi:hypothetical protein